MSIDSSGLAENPLRWVFEGIVRCVGLSPVEHPMNVVAARAQLNHHLSSIAVIRQIYGEKGARGYYNGFVAKLGSRVTKEGMRWTTIAWTTNFWKKIVPENQINGALPKVLTGTTTAVMETCVFTPIHRLFLERVKLLTYGEFFRGEVRIKGAQILFSGLGISLIRNVSTWASFMYFFHWYHKNVKASCLFAGCNPLVGETAANALTAVSMVVLTCPIDVTRTQMMGTSKYQNQRIIPVVKDLYNTLGARGFYKGFLPSVVNCFVHSAAGGKILERIQENLYET